MSKSFFKLISFDNNTLLVLSNRHQLETLKFKIVSKSSEFINGVEHTKLVSNNNDLFFVVKGQFHREDDQPAVICSLFVLSSYNKKLKKSKCSMWLKNGFFHRNQKLLPFKCPAFIYQYYNNNNLTDFFMTIFYKIKNI